MIFFYLISSFLISISNSNCPEFVQDSLIEKNVKEYVITEIVFLGNTKMKEQVLLKSLGFNPKKAYSYEEINSKVNFLHTLNGVFRANFELIQKANSYDLQISIEEQLTLLPIVNFGIQKSNLWGQIGIVDLNLLGYGNELLVYYQNNQGNHTGEIYYKHNRIFNKPISISANLLRWSSVEPVNFSETNRFDYDFTINQASIGLEYFYNNQIRFSTGISGFREIYKSYSLEVPGPTYLNLRKGLVKFEIEFSNIKYEGIYKNNFIVRLSSQNVYTLEYDQYFHSLVANLRYYNRVRRKTEFAIQINSGISSNYDSPFAPFVIDSYVNVRAAGNRIVRGTGILNSNIEVREELLSFNKIIFQGVYFIDASSIRLPGESIQFNLDETNYFISTGLGLRIHYTKIYNATLRMDFGYEITNKSPQFVVGLGQYF
jgi:hypothetical protein